MLTFLAVVYGIASIFLVIFVLLQAGKGAGMGIFGGGGSNTTFGAQGGDILTRITTVLGILFFGIAMIIALIVSRDTTVSSQWATPPDESEAVEQIVAPGYESEEDAEGENDAEGADETQTGNNDDAADTSGATNILTIPLDAGGETDTQ